MCKPWLRHALQMVLPASCSPDTDGASCKMGETPIRKHSWSAIFGTVQSILSDDMFNACVANIAAPPRPKGQPQAVGSQAGSGMRERRRCAPAAFDACANVQRHVEERRPSGQAEDACSFVQRNAEELRAGLRGSYPGDAPDTLCARRYSSSRSGHRPQSAQSRSSAVPRSSPAAPPSNTRSAGERAASVGLLSKKQQSGTAVSSGVQRPSPADRKRSSFSKPPPPAGNSGRRSPTTEGSASGKCDKCDGAHSSDACPHFKKTRESHKDAWAHYGTKRPLPQMGASCGNFTLRSGRCVKQPGDGSCLFHSLCYGLSDGRSSRISARDLREQLAKFIGSNPKLDIAGDTIEEWVSWDSSLLVKDYAKRMAVSGWGGGLEMAACSLLKRVNVHVYERGSGGFKRISCFDCPEAAKKTVHVLYQGGVHYDALVPGEN